MSDLVKNQELYASFKKDVYIDLHAIYEPDNGDFHGDCFCAAVDLFAPGMTFRVYFTLGNDGQIQVEHTERWYFG